MVREASGTFASAFESEAAEDDDSDADDEAFEELSLFSSLSEHDAKQPMVIVIAIKNADIFFIMVIFPFLLNIHLII